MKTATKKLSIMVTLWHRTGIELDWDKSMVSTSSLVKFAGMMLETWSRLGLSVSLEIVRIRRVNKHRRMFLRITVTGIGTRDG